MKACSAMILVVALIFSLSGCTSCSSSNTGSSASSHATSSTPAIVSAPESIEDAIESNVTSMLEPDKMPSSTPESTPSTTTTMSADFAKIGALGKEKVKWGPGVQKDEENRPIACTSLQEQYGKYSTYFLGSKIDKKIHLTFDQGYENGFTATILDTLKEKDVQVVFFVTGHYVKTNPELVQRMIDEGHILGNHGMNHRSFPEVPLSEAQDDLMTLHQYMLDNFNYEMNLFRFPEGEFNEQSVALVQSMGYQSVFWSFAYQDWDVKNQMTGEKALKKIGEGANHNGAIMLLHAVGKTNSEILGQSIDNLRADGFTFCLYDLPA